MDKQQLDKQQLIKRLELTIDEIARSRAWANIEIEFLDGIPNMIRTTRNEKLISQETTRGPQYERR
jgi:hypothetical protein